MSDEQQKSDACYGIRIVGDDPQKVSEEIFSLELELRGIQQKIQELKGKRDNPDWYRNYVISFPSEVKDVSIDVLDIPRSIKGKLHKGSFIDVKYLERDGVTQTVDTIGQLIQWMATYRTEEWWGYFSRLGGISAKKIEVALAQLLESYNPK